MPIYEYRCTQCSRTTEVMQRSGAPAPLCPHCIAYGDSMVKLPTYAAFRITPAAPNTR